MVRSQELEAFINAAKQVLDSSQGDTAATAAKVFASLSGTAQPHPPAPGEVPQPTEHLSVVSHLGPALATAARGQASATAGLAPLAGAISALAPALQWRRKPVEDAEPRFRDGHANCLIFGPHGVEHRDDLRIGMSLLAPNVRYPDHSHPPEEVYIVMSEGEWFRPDVGWYSPGIGGFVHHPPAIVHAMRSHRAPLLAVWMLPG